MSDSHANASIAPPDGPREGSPESARQFGLGTGYALVVASMVGAGILATSGYTLRDTGNPAALIALWIVGGGMALCGALTVVELATTLPHVGGDYVFVREAYGRHAGIVAGWATFVLGFAAPTAVIARLAIDYLLVPIGSWFSHWPPEQRVALSRALASLLIVAVSFGHGLGHRQSAWLQGSSTFLKTLLLVAMALAALIWGQGDLGHFAQGGWPTAPQWSALATGLVYVGYAYSGWNGAAYIAGEIRDPARLLPRATIWGCLSVIALYVLINVVYVYALDPAAMMQRSPAEVERVAELATTALFGPRAAALVSAVLGLGLIASVSAYLLAGPRIAVAMARDRAFPQIASRLHPTRGTPVIATLAQTAAAIAIVWSGSFAQILDYASIGLAAIAALVVVCVFPLRRRPDLVRPYSVPLYPLPPIVFLLLSAGTIAVALLDRDRRVPSLLSLATLAAGIPVARLVLRKDSGVRS